MSWADHPRTASDDEPEASPGTGARDTETSDTPEQSASESAVLELVREESRVVLDEQIELLGRSTTRRCGQFGVVLVLSLVVSVAQFGGGTLTPWTGFLSAAGVTFLIVALLVGVYTYSVSSVEFGIGETHRTSSRIRVHSGGVAGVPCAGVRRVDGTYGRDESPKRDSASTDTARDGLLTLLSSVAVSIATGPRVAVPVAATLVATLGVF